MERVFPIRCNILEHSPHIGGAHQKQEIERQRVVLVETPQSEPSESLLRVPTHSPESPTPGPGHNHENELPWPANFSLPLPSSARSSVSSSTPLVYSEECEYAFTDENEHGVVNAKRSIFTRCEDEPIHSPGSIQSHGMLVGLDIQEDGVYLCLVVSENSEAICKYKPRKLLSLSNFLAVFPVHQRSVFTSNALCVKKRFYSTQKTIEPKIFSVSFIDPDGRLIPTWCAMHFISGAHNLLICEFEHQMPDASIKRRRGDDLPAAPIASLPYNSLSSGASDISSSFAMKSQPLNVTTEVSELFQGEGRTIEVLDLISQIQQQLSAQESIRGLLDTIVGLVKELTGFHRCMVYQFDEENNGEVVAELLEPKASSDVFRGLRFPASDIPKQARDLYMISRVRVFFDRDQQPSRLICKSPADLDTPLDLSHAYLRGMSPVHQKYLSNMGVRSTMSVALQFDNQLWGLICCHSYGPTGLRLPFPLREMCYWIGLSASSCLDRLLNEEKNRARRHMIDMQLKFDPHIWLSGSSEGFLRLFGADFGFLVVQSESRTIGRLSSYAEAVTLMRYVCFRNFRKVVHSRNITKDFSDLVYQPGFDQIGGLLCIPLSQEPGDFILLFKSRQIKEVHWAGKPTTITPRTGRLEPRNSFKKWTEVVRATCQPWSDESIEAAAITKLIYGNFINLWREKEATSKESRMKRMLFLNLSHEVRTPLNAVVNCLDIALEKSLDQTTRELLQTSHTASKSLIYVIDDLLQLTSGPQSPAPPLVNASFDLHKAMETSLERMKVHALQKSIAFDIVKDQDFPQYVLGDLQRLQRAVTTLVANAIEFTIEGGVTVHLGVVSSAEDSCVVLISVQDTGKGMTEQELEELFQDFEQIADEKPPQTPEEIPTESTSGLGIGLALLARYVMNSGGQIRGTSTAGKGSRFSLEIPFCLVTDPADIPVSLSRGSTSSMNSEVSERDTQIPKRPNLPHLKYQTSTGHVQHFMTSRRRHSELPGASHTRFQFFSPPALNAAIPEMEEMRPKTVLIADDNSINLALLQRKLKKMGYEVQSGRDGQQAFDIYQKCRDTVYFVLMDLNMPIVGGVDSARMIRVIEGKGHSTSTSNSPNGGKKKTLPLTLQVPTETPQTSYLHSRLASHSEAISPGSIGPPDIPTPDSGNGDVDGPPLETQSFIIQPATPPPISTFPHLHHPKRPPLIRPEQSYFPLHYRDPPPSTSQTPPTHRDSPSSLSGFESPFFRKRVPIFAVSAGLNMFTQEGLMEAGFDGWLPKPVDFARLDLILKGAVDGGARAKGRYWAKDFKAGGWFS